MNYGDLKQKLKIFILVRTSLIKICITIGNRVWMSPPGSPTPGITEDLHIPANSPDQELETALENNHKSPQAPERGGGGASVFNHAQLEHLHYCE